MPSRHVMAGVDTMQALPRRRMPQPARRRGNPIEQIGPQGSGGDVDDTAAGVETLVGPQKSL
jgi:hypothetical protein